ncbi:venom acid phosphatase Acph-1-like isoform X2 [Anoplophora glabripennis]|uniref:venom acid phosphatase Acph-1-like isoform X2 n=1 Tax=Anoplophora glabripennis TaxID=217634 RepID=UPI000874054B|nr:venom acid phosphatase Acph-1-like isoform X2 [Anoplophora glabripennis]
MKSLVSYLMHLSALLVVVRCEFSNEDDSIVFPSDPEDNQNTLVLLNVLFRHGNRTADSQAELYPNDPYLNETYFPYGLGQLTNAGKKREFSIGTALRKRYNNFLGEYYYPQVVEALSTDYNRTKMSLQLVLAGLFPPRKEDMLQPNIYWQPVPYNYVPRSQDKLLIGVQCPRYTQIYEKYSSSPKMQATFKKFKKQFDYISRNSGLNVTSFLDVYQLYFGLSTESEYGFILPAWTNAVWPDTIVNLAIKEYYVSMATTDMRRMAAGYLLKKIVEDAKRKIVDGNRLGRKIHLYSAHENNVAELLISLGVFKPHVPNYGAYAVIELHKISNQYKIKIVYENYDGYGPEVLKMPGCDTLCPLDRFVSLIKEYFPSDSLCGN